MQIYQAKPASPFLPLGYQGENNCRQIVFDISDWQTQYGAGTVQLAHQRGGDDAPYPVSVTGEGNKAIWTVQSADVAVAGSRGHCQLSYLVDDKIVKSLTWRTEVYPSLGENGEAPAPYLTWMDALRQEIAGIATEGVGIAAITLQGQDADGGNVYTVTLTDGTTSAITAPRGLRGTDGKTPIRGSDYWTDTDKQEIVEDVLECVDVPETETKIKIAGTVQTPDSEGYVEIPCGVYNTYSLFLTSNGQGMGVTVSRGYLVLTELSNAQITSRTKTMNLAVTAKTLDYAVKAAMTDGKGAAWTDTERLAALLRMGCTVDADGFVKWTAQEV